MTVENSVPKKLFICAVDGPAGSGKSSVGRRVAAELDWSFVSTGLFYRALALHMDVNGAAMHDGDAVAIASQQIVPLMRWDFEQGEIVIEGRRYGALCSSEKAGKLASLIAKNPRVREFLLPVQRNLVTATEKKGVIVEGRDVGTVVFPDADLKIFFTASLEERARRRAMELSAEDAKEIFDEIRKRDEQDSSRKSAPLIKAHDAVELDTSTLTLDDAKKFFLEEIRKKIAS